MKNVPAAWSLTPSASESNLNTFLLIIFSCNREAYIEFGDTVASRLKLSADGTIVLWPQPTDDPEDPQNVRLHLIGDHVILTPYTFQWPERRKTIQLTIVILASIVADFDSGIGQ
jgi:hypothetical protein